jgi:hypothetical protein
MNGKVFSSLLVLVLAGVVIVSLGGGCANIVPPTGGPRDSLPPVLVFVSPKDSSENFNAKKITFSFNEFITVENIRENLVVSPVPKTDPIIEGKLRTVTIRIKDTLEPNTTYAYNFGKAIKDINEGNILNNFTYIFSTGDHIDSLGLSGRVTIAQTGLPDSTMIAMLHLQGDDSTVVKKKPRYFAKLDSAGNFRFGHLPAGVFYLYAMKDETGQKTYRDKTRQLFAFADKPITIGSNNAPVNLMAYIEKDTSTKKPFGGSKPAVKTDKEKEKDKRLKFTLNLENNQLDILGNLVFSFTDPLKNFDSSKTQFTDEEFNLISNHRFQKDTSNKKLVLSYKWPPDAVFHLIVNKDFAEDTLGHTIARTDTLTFTTMKESDYGNVGLRFNNLDLSKKPVLQLLQSDIVKDSARLTSKDFRIRLFRPGEYDIRILLDENGNGTWDHGEFFNIRRQPEKVIAVKQKLNVKANWDNDNTIDL